MNKDIQFSRLMLRQLRAEAKSKRVKLPAGMTALKSGCGDWYLVEARGGFREEVCAHNAFDAKCKVIDRLIPNEELSPLIRGTRMALGLPL